MAHRTALSILFMLLMTVWAVQATASLNFDTVEQLSDRNIVAAVVGVDRTAELFGNTYKQAVLLYKDHSDDLADLKKLPDLVMQLKNEISELKAPNKEDSAKVKQLVEENAGLKKQLEDAIRKAIIQEATFKDLLKLLAHQLNISKLIAEYKQHKNWAALRTGLEAALSHNSTAYRQLQTVPWQDEEAPERIGGQGLNELALVLSAIGSGVEISGATGSTMLHGAAIRGQVYTAEQLLDNGANIEAKNDWGNTPMVHAAKYNHTAMVRYLKDRGADVNGASHYGWTGLHWAAQNGNEQIVKFLVQAGADTTLKDKDNKTPLDVAREFGHTSLEQYFL